MLSSRFDCLVFEKIKKKSVLNLIIFEIKLQTIQLDSDLQLGLIEPKKLMQSRVESGILKWKF